MSLGKEDLHWSGSEHLVHKRPTDMEEVNC